MFVGIYFGAGVWIAHTRPSRKIVVVNTVQPDVAARMLVALGHAGPAPVEFVYASEATKSGYTMPGIVEPSLIDLAEFAPTTRDPNARFTVGRLSRDHETKHHENDPEFYRRLTAAGFAVKVMGGSVLDKAMAGNVPEGLSLLPAGAEPAASFLNGLDCFFYRTQSDWFEAYGRVVFEAMAAELPVVAGRNGGYAAYIEHGVNGFLFDTDDEAFAILQRLKNDPALRARVGKAGRQTVERIYGPVALSAIRSFYLRETPAPPPLT